VLARIIEKSINNILTTLSISIFSIVPTHVETVVCLSNKNAKPKDYVEIGVDAVDYYNIKSAEKDV
jgi:23S rRNA (uracil1939-C5)-methyltransferase